MSFYAKRIITFLAICFWGAMSAGSVVAAAPNYGPDNIQITDIGFSNITISWSAVTSDPTLRGYRIERESPVGGGFSPIVINTQTSATTYTDTGLSSGVTYNYRVAAVNSDGIGPYSSYSISGTTLAQTSFPPPGRPQNLRAVAVSGSEIDLAWNAPSSSQPVTGYKIERSGSGDFYVIVRNTNSAGTSFRDSNLSSGATYSYKVSAVNLYGTSDPSLVVYATTLIAPGPPRSVSVRPGDGQVSISWTEPTWNGGNVSTYTITGGPTNIVLSASSTSAVITGLTNGTAYYFSITARNGGGESLPAQASTVTPLAAMTPASYEPSVTPVATTTAVDTAPSPSVSSLEDQIKSLQALLDSLKLKFSQSASVPPSAAPQTAPEVRPSQGTVPAASSRASTRNLYIGLSGNDVRDLQLLLISQHVGPAGDSLQLIGATGYFGSLTKDALVEFQASVGIKPATGYFGPKTRAYLGY